MISCTIPEHHLVKMFINNAHPSLAHHRVMNYLLTYKDIKDKGMSLEQGLIKDGFIRLYKEIPRTKARAMTKLDIGTKTRIQ